MDNIVSTIITQLPNLGVAVWMLWQQGRTIQAMLDNQTKLIDRLLTYIDNDKAAARQIVTEALNPPKQ